MSQIRAFIAVELNSKIKNLIKSIQEDLKTIKCDIKWVAPDNAHITLKFLGNTDIDKIETIKDIITSCSKRIKTFDITAAEIGAFPKKEHPRTLWIGTQESTPVLSDLASILDDQLGHLGFEKEEKKFMPHITIGRIKSNKNLSLLAERLKGYKIEHIIKQTVKYICLTKSSLTKTGPIYQTIERFHIK